MSPAEEIQALEQNLTALLHAYSGLQDKVRILEQANAAQREQLLQTSAELVQMRANYSNLQTAHNMVTDADAKVQARRRIDALIARIDQTIELLKE